MSGISRRHDSPLFRKSSIISHNPQAHPHVYVVAVETPSRQQTEQNNTHNGIGNQHLRRGALRKNKSSYGEHQSNKKYPILGLRFSILNMVSTKAMCLL